MAGEYSPAIASLGHYDPAIIYDPVRSVLFRSVRSVNLTRGSRGRCPKRPRETALAPWLQSFFTFNYIAPYSQVAPVERPSACMLLSTQRRCSLASSTWLRLSVRTLVVQTLPQQFSVPTNSNTFLHKCVSCLQTQQTTSHWAPNHICIYKRSVPCGRAIVNRIRVRLARTLHQSLSKLGRQPRRKQKHSFARNHGNPGVGKSTPSPGTSAQNYTYFYKTQIYEHLCYYTASGKKIAEAPADSRSSCNDYFSKYGPPGPFPVRSKK